MESLLEQIWLMTCQQILRMWFTNCTSHSPLGCELQPSTRYSSMKHSRETTGNQAEGNQQVVMVGCLPFFGKSKKSGPNRRVLDRGPPLVTPGDFLKEVVIPVFTGGFGGFVGSEVGFSREPRE